MLNKKTEDDIEITGTRVEGFTKSVVKDLNGNSAAKKMVVDTLNMSDSQKTRLVETINKALEEGVNYPKELVILE